MLAALAAPVNSLSQKKPAGKEKGHVQHSMCSWWKKTDSKNNLASFVREVFFLQQAVRHSRTTVVVSACQQCCLLLSPKQQRNICNESLKELRWWLPHCFLTFSFSRSHQFFSQKKVQPWNDEHQEVSPPNSLCGRESKTSSHMRLPTVSPFPIHQVHVWVCLLAQSSCESCLFTITFLNLPCFSEILVVSSSAHWLLLSYVQLSSLNAHVIVVVCLFF